MGLSPYLCRVRRFTKKEIENGKTKDRNTIYDFNLVSDVPTGEGLHFETAWREREMFIEKFHKHIVYEDIIYTDYAKLRKKILKDNPNADIDIVGWGDEEAWVKETTIIGEKLNDEDTETVNVQITNGDVNYMQLGYYHSSYKRHEMLYRKCKYEVHRLNETICEEYTVKCPVIYYEVVKYIPFGFYCFKRSSPKWLLRTGLILTNSKLKAYIDNMKNCLGKDILEDIYDRGGLKDDEFIDMGY